MTFIVIVALSPPLPPASGRDGHVEEEKEGGSCGGHGGQQQVGANVQLEAHLHGGIDPAESVLGHGGFVVVAAILLQSDQAKRSKAKFFDARKFEFGHIEAGHRGKGKNSKLLNTVFNPYLHFQVAVDKFDFLLKAFFFLQNSNLAKKGRENFHSLEFPGRVSLEFLFFVFAFSPPL